MTLHVSILGKPFNWTRLLNNAGLAAMLGGSAMLSACGGGGSGTPPATTTPPVTTPPVTTPPVTTPPPTYTIGGNVSGLNFSGLVLANGGETLNVPANATSYAFPTGLPAGASYNVSVVKQPPDFNNFCRSLSGTGTVGSANVLTALIDCGEASGAGTLLAGGGNAGNANGSATAARFNGPSDVAVDASGNTYVADVGNAVVRKIDSAGVVTNFVVNTALGTQAITFKPGGVAVQASGTVYVSDTAANMVLSVTPAGVKTTLAGLYGNRGSINGPNSAATFNGPKGLAVDGAGNVYVADAGNQLIRKITPDGTVSTLAGSGQQGNANGAATSASFNDPERIAVDGAGNVYVADVGNKLVRKITPAGQVSTLAGAAIAASVGAVAGVASDAAGNVYVTDSANQLIAKVSSAGTVTTLAGSGLTGRSDGNAATASFNRPQGLALDGAGNVYVADFGNNLVRKLSAAAVVSTVAGDTVGVDVSTLGGVATDAAGNVYIADPGANAILKLSQGALTTLAGGGVPGKADGSGAAASFSGPQGVAVDGSGNVFVTDTGNNLIRKITSGGVVTTVVGIGGGLNAPQGIAIDTAGSLYVADTGNHLIRVISPVGSVSTLAGSGVQGAADGIRNAASFNSPAGVAVDVSGNVYVADTGNVLIRKITPSGAVSTIATPGNGLVKPTGVAVSAAGYLYVADLATVRKISPAGVTTKLFNTDGLSPRSGRYQSFVIGNIALDAAGNLLVSGSGPKSDALVQGVIENAVFIIVPKLGPP